eukprot:UN27409
MKGNEPHENKIEHLTRDQAIRFKKYCENLIKQYPNNEQIILDANYVLGLSFHLNRNIGEAHGAIVYYENVLKINENHIYSINNLAHVYMMYEENLLHKAEKLYQRVAKICPNFAEPWHNLGQLYKDHFEDYKTATEYFEKSIIVGSKM